MGWTEQDILDHGRRTPGGLGAKPLKNEGRIKNISPVAARTYNGRVYHSKSEAEYAQRLDFQVRAGIVTKWIPQVHLPIKINEVKVCDVVTDFHVFFADGTEEYVEIKGFETETWRLKKRLLLACYPGIRYTVLKVGADL